MMSRDEYNSLVETLYLSSNEKVKQSIIEGMKLNHDDCVNEEDIDW